MRFLNRPLCVLFALLSLASNVYAQTEGSAFTLTGMGVATPFATDYQALGINPANLDLKNQYERRATFGFIETGVSLYSEVLSKTDIRKNLYQEKMRDLTVNEKRQYALEFANSRNAIDLDVMTSGVSIQTNKLGSFAFSTRERIDYYSEFGPQIAELMWLGYSSDYFDSLVVENANGTFDTIPNMENIDPEMLEKVVKGITALQNAQSISELLKGTVFKFSWIQEYNLGWGKRILNKEKFQLHGGVGLKLLVGRGMTEIIADGNHTSVFGALSPLFGIDYDEISSNNPSALPKDASKLKPVGMGFGFDLGATAVFHDKFFLSGAVTDIGSVTWSGNVYTLNDINLVEFENGGLDNVDFVEQIEKLNGSDAILEWQGTSSRTTKLPSTMRAGFGFNNMKNIKVGVDVIAPLSDELGSLEKAVIAVGGEFSPIKHIHLQAGVVQGGNYGTKIPVGIYFTLGKGAYEFGVSSRDFVTFFRNNEPTLSMAFGFLRFRV
jgi:hypothetical protein